MRPRVSSSLAAPSESRRSLPVSATADVEREHNVADFIVALDDLWLSSEADRGRFAEHARGLRSFVELAPVEEEIVDATEIAASFAAFVLLHAVEFRATSDVDEALRCAHASLTFLDLLAQNLVGSRLRNEEERFQLDDVAGLGARENYQEVSRRRLMVVLNRR